MTLNINGCTSWTRLRILSDFVHRHEIEILLLHEVSTEKVSHITGYTTHLNIGDSECYMSILVKEDLELTRVRSLASGRALAAVYASVGLVNIYEPPGTSQRQACETFYNVDLPYLFGFLLPDVIMGGDFNCVWYPEDCTWERTFIGALDRMIRHLNFIDAWTKTAARKTSTQCATTECGTPR